MEAILAPKATSLARMAGPSALYASRILMPAAGTNRIQHRSFGIKTTLRVQEHISKMIKADQKKREGASQAQVHSSAGSKMDSAVHYSEHKEGGKKSFASRPPQPVTDPLFETMPKELLISEHPQPMRPEIMSHKWNTKDLEDMDIEIHKHRIPKIVSDKLALWAIKAARKPTDIFFRTKYLHRAVMLEVVAAVPGMVGALVRHIKSLQGMRHDGGWISHLLHEAENERMHLMTWMALSRPVFWERLLIGTVQTGFFGVFSLLYLISPRTAHRAVGYLEEEAVTSYNHFIDEIDSGNIENVAAPQIAIDYWNLTSDATLRDVVMAVRADEALHRDTNHHFSDRILAKRENLREDIEKFESQ